MKANQDIRDKARAYGVHLYEIANRFGVSEPQFSRWMRHEFPAKKKEQALCFINEIYDSRYYRNSTTDVFRWVNNKIEKPDMKDNGYGAKESEICIIRDDYNSPVIAFCAYDPTVQFSTKVVNGDYFWITNDGETLDDSAVKAWAYIPEWRES